MRTIWKYPLELTDHQIVSMPKGAIVLTIQQQGKQVCLWAIVNPDAPMVEYPIRIHGTGHTLPADANSYEHIGTFQLSDGALVLHAFRVLSPAEVVAKIL